MIFTQDDLLKIVEKAIAFHEKSCTCTVIVDMYTLAECLEKTGESLGRDFPSSQAPGGYDLSPYKLAGILCFWIRKLKPFRVADRVLRNGNVNEALGFLTGLSLVLGQNPKLRSPEIPPSFIHDIIKSFRYNSHSPNSSAFIFESLCL